MNNMGRNIFSIPNMLSLLRLSLVPVLLGLAVSGKSDAFLQILAISLVTDVLDGYLARRLDQASELGAKLDSCADMFTYGSMILGIYWLWPGVFTAQTGYLLAAALSFTLPVALALSKLGEYPSYHTLAAKVTALLFAPAYYLLILGGDDLFFRVVILFHVLVAMEEIAITLILQQPRSDVRSVFSLRGEVVPPREP